MTWQMADIWENIAKAIPDKPAVVDGEKCYNWAEYENRAARVAQIYTDHGLEAGAKLAIYAYNSAEYMEAQFGAFKARICPVNVNYRYLEAELTHVINNSDSEALVFQAQFAPRVAAIRDQLEQIKLFLEIDDGSGEHLAGSIPYEETLQKTEPMPVIERSNDDLYMLYTGGTTGMPKGVMYDHKSFASALLAKGFEMREMVPPTDANGFGPLVQQLHAAGATSRGIPACPIMHGTGMWIGAMIPHSLGGAVILFDNSHFDPKALWQLAADQKATDITIVGDVFAKPMLAALENAKAAGQAFDLSSLQMIGSSGVMWSTDVKRGLLDHLPHIMIVDSMGSTEGSMGSSITTKDNIDIDQTAKFEMNPTTKVLTEDGKPVAPGSGEMGMICNGGMVPLGYYKDEAKSAATFKTFDGVRYSIPGDFATVEEDGSITLLGRGSACINSGGEKIFPEEVEEALKTHESVYDCLVVGIPDDRFGQKVTAVLSLCDGATFDADALQEHVRGQLAAYKAPRAILQVDTVPRAANGKAGYKDAKEIALKMLDLEIV
ncbi:acyl-CoA synthetase [Parasphingorhabdus halotolerans]|uniref:Acyl-CoA synthetase n=1 Tax=Parasphingorhabdus halotolerans TaxID=2725558 RepID=A0A6H2DMR9_9SPHN|nr:acyl-CoA synthetase [Parasphingorhabdus halotolerans]QJB69680.1 acyl-CoA synthetase [Parasphingorhabdus halotolerans]